MGLNARTHLYARRFFDDDHEELTEAQLERAWHLTGAAVRQVYLDRATEKIRKERGNMGY